MDISDYCPLYGYFFCCLRMSGSFNIINTSTVCPMYGSCTVPWSCCIHSRRSRVCHFELWSWWGNSQYWGFVLLASVPFLQSVSNSFLSSVSFLPVQIWMVLRYILLLFFRFQSQCQSFWVSEVLWFLIYGSHYILTLFCWKKYSSHRVHDVSV